MTATRWRRTRPPPRRSVPLKLGSAFPVPSAILTPVAIAGAEAAAAPVHAAEDAGPDGGLPGRHDHHDLHAAEGRSPSTLPTSPHGVRSILTLFVLQVAMQRAKVCVRSVTLEGRSHLRLVKVQDLQPEIADHETAYLDNMCR